VPVEKQIAIIFCGTQGLLRDVPVAKVKEFETAYIEYLDLKHRDVLDKLSQGILDNDITDVLEKTAVELTARYRSQA